MKYLSSAYSAHSLSEPLRMITSSSAPMPNLLQLRFQFHVVVEQHPVLGSREFGCLLCLALLDCGLIKRRLPIVALHVQQFARVACVALRVVGENKRHDGERENRHE